MKLRNQIPALLIPLIVFPLFVLGWIAYDKLRAVSEQGVSREMQASMYKLSTYMNTQLATAKSNIELFSKHTLVKKYVVTRNENHRYGLMLPPLLSLFRSYHEAFPEYYEIRIFLPDGYEDVRQTFPLIDNQTDEEAENPIFQEMTKSTNPAYTAVFRNPDNQEISLFVGRSLYLRDNTLDALHIPPTLRGYLALTVRLQYLTERIKKEVIGQEGYLFATDADGNILFHADTVDLPERVPEGFLRKAHTVDSDIGSTRMPFNGGVAFINKVKLHPNLYLFVVLPEDELLAISFNLAVIVATITLITIAVTMAFLLSTLEYLVVRPIHRLRNLAKGIGRGEWSIKSGLRSNNEIGELAVSIEEMAVDLKRSDEQVRYLAYHDNLTGLPNRFMFGEYLGHAIAHARRSSEKLAVLFLDIDDFKRVNDTLGHQSGDVLLQEVAERLSRCLRETDYVAVSDDPDKPSRVLARQGGDEFIILLPDIKHMHDPSAVSTRLIESLQQPIDVKGHECYTSASIGISIYPNDGGESEDLIKNADNAMYHAKELGKNSYQYFQESMNTVVAERLALETKLRKAPENNQFTLYYQTQVDAANSEVIGLEALLRWRDPDAGLIPPNVFIPVAEQTGLIIPIGEWVLYEACRQGAAWQKEGYPRVRISVNVSTVQFSQEGFVNTIQRALTESEFDPTCLEIELTESAIMTNPEGAADVLADIKGLGASIALDDFGTGYSSLNYLRRFPIDTLKIDQSFIEDVDKNPEDKQIVAAIIAMAHAMELRVVAEGVETQDQLRVVSDNDCDMIQGFLFSLPAPAEQIFQHEQKLRINIA